MSKPEVSKPMTTKPIWLAWVASFDRPNPWEAWKRMPLWIAVPSEKTLLAAYYRKEHEIEVLEYRQLSTTPEPYRVKLARRGVMRVAGQRGLRVAIRVAPRSFAQLTEDGWRPVAAPPEITAKLDRSTARAMLRTYVDDHRRSQPGAFADIDLGAVAISERGGTTTVTAKRTRKVRPSVYAFVVDAETHALSHKPLR